MTAAQPAITRQVLADALLSCGPWRCSGDDQAIIDHARAQARAVELEASALDDPGYAYQRAARRVERHCLEAPEQYGIAGGLARMSCEMWWRRQLRRLTARRLEQRERLLGRVHKRAGIYVSHQGYQRRRDQTRRNAALLEAVAATNQHGQEYTLAELSELGLANPSHRRAELMLRIRDTEEEARRLGHVGMFYTLTCPSRFHAVLSKSCTVNPRYRDADPREAQRHLQGVWARARAKLDRDGLGVYGVRVVEPHHDGTPHWHLLLWMRPEDVAAVSRILRDYASREDAHELSTDRARRARFDATTIDYSRGTAAGYVAKYISKNINGSQFADADHYGHDLRDSAPRIEAWASTWGIRQFQFIGLPSVTVWRELRRLRDDADVDAWEAATRPDPEAAAILGELRRAANAGDWSEFLRLMGGPMAGRQGQPVRPWRVVRQTAEPTLADATTGEATHDVKGRYGEPVAGTWGLVVTSSTGEAEYLTRLYRWTIEPKGQAEAIEVPANGRAPRRLDADSLLWWPLTLRAGGAPWTCVDNCTRPLLEPWEAKATEAFRAMTPPIYRGEVEAIQRQSAADYARHEIAAAKRADDRQAERDRRATLERAREKILDLLLAGHITQADAGEYLTA